MAMGITVSENATTSDITDAKAREIGNHFCDPKFRSIPHGEHTKTILA